MSSFRIRPRFKHKVKGDKATIEGRIQEALSAEAYLTSTYLPGHIYIRVKPTIQHFWSPQLHLTFEEANDGVIVRGLYGPNPTLWAVFFFGYVALGLLTLFIGMWGLSRWSLGMPSQMLWSIPVFGVIALMMYFSAQAGQKLGAQQMFDIHHFYESITKEKIAIN